MILLLGPSLDQDLLGVNLTKQVIQSLRSAIVHERQDESQRETLLLMVAYTTLRIQRHPVSKSIIDHRQFMAFLCLAIIDNIMVL